MSVLLGAFFELLIASGVVGTSRTTAKPRLTFEPMPARMAPELEFAITHGTSANTGGPWRTAGAWGLCGGCVSHERRTERAASTG